MPKSTGRPAGSKSVLFKLTYDTISAWTGLKVWTLKQYAKEGRYDPRDIDSVLRFCNQQRIKRGWPLLGGQVRAAGAI